MSFEENARLDAEIGETWARRELDHATAAEAFFRLADQFYKKNFGTFSKSEFDLFMFEVFFTAFENKQKSTNQMLEDTSHSSNSFTYISELNIAVQLGITPRRVSNLREKLDIRQNKYSEKGWVEELLKVLDDSKIYQNGDYAKFLLPSKYSKTVLEDALIKGGYFYEYTLNSRTLSLPVSTLFALILECLEETSNSTSGKGDSDIYTSLVSIAEAQDIEIPRSLKKEFDKGSRNKELLRTIVLCVFEGAMATGTVASFFGIIPNPSSVRNSLGNLINAFKGLANNVSKKKKKKGTKDVLS